MPIHLPSGLRRLDEREFGQAAYDVMQVVFAVHNEMGRLFDEPVYQRAIARRLPGARIEVPVEVSFESFRKGYSLDLLVAGGAVFELKTAEALHDRHRAQLLNYLFLTELPHGKLVNLRGDLVEHEFVNAPLTRAERTCFQVADDAYTETGRASRGLRDLLVAMLRDWGTGLDVALYEEAVIHFHGGEEHVATPVEIFADGARVGQQKLNLLAPDTAFCVTALNDRAPHYEGQLRRFIRHTKLKAMQWFNVSRKVVTFKTIKA
jgi:GxxExxY protein